MAVPASSLPDQLARLAHNSSPDLAMVETIVRDVFATMEGDIDIPAHKIKLELQELQQYIMQAKVELAHLSPVDISEEHIATAADELEAIVRATEEATGKILDAAEKIENVASSVNDPAASDALTEAVTTIYEASNFQDITGQRITKVVNALQHIDAKLITLIKAFNPQYVPTEKSGVAKSKSTASVDDPQSLLNGPQLPESAASQDDIDALFDSLD